LAYWEEEEEEDEEENESYLASYSDLVTDLMAVFVLLLSFALLSQGIKVRESAEKMAGEIVAEQLAKAGIEATADALPGENASETSTPTAQPTLAADGAFLTIVPDETDEEESSNDLYEAIRAYNETSGLSGQLSVTKQTDKLILLRVHSSIFFELGSADIEPSADPIMEDVCAIFVKYQKHIKKLGD
jgi:chemotaxis protein MotB